MSLNNVFFCLVSTKTKLRPLKPADESLGIVLALEENKKVLIHVSAAELISIYFFIFSDNSRGLCLVSKLVM